MGTCCLIQLITVYVGLQASQISAVNFKTSKVISINNKVVPQSNVTHKMSLPYNEVRLRCFTNGNTNSTNNSENHNITWNFMPCTPGTNRSSCEHVLKTSWSGKKLCGDIWQKPCKPTFIISKPTVASSGLYRCNMLEGKDGFFITNPLITYQLEIFDGSIKEPVFIETPKNVKVVAPYQAVLSCQIRSVLSLKIHWFKQVDEGTPTKNYQIHYMNKVYELLNSTALSKPQSNVYISKLIFKTTSPSDSGTYVCGAFGDAGIQYKEATLEVEPFQINQSVTKVEYTQNKWEIFGSVMIFIVIVLFACCWSVGFCYFRIFQEAFDEEYVNGNEDEVRRRQIHMDVIGSETSDYEHIITI